MQPILFNFLTGYSYQTEYRKLLVAPINLREKMIELIRRETDNKANGKDARIIVKINSLTDDQDHSTNFIELRRPASKLI